MSVPGEYGELLCTVTLVTHPEDDRLLRDESKKKRGWELDVVTYGGDTDTNEPIKHPDGEASACARFSSLQPKSQSSRRPGRRAGAAAGQAWTGGAGALQAGGRWSGWTGGGWGRTRRRRRRSCGRRCRGAARWWTRPAATLGPRARGRVPPASRSWSSLGPGRRGRGERGAARGGACGAGPARGSGARGSTRRSRWTSSGSTWRCGRCAQVPSRENAARAQCTPRQGPPARRSADTARTAASSPAREGWPPALRPTGADGPPTAAEPPD